MLVFLVGMPGSGKSYWARKLASALSVLDLDMDSYIENRAGISIGEMFAQGEDYFRIQEHEALIALIKELKNDIVIATGGGTPCFYQNMDVMLHNGLVVYLRAPIDYIAGNLMKSKVQRPLLMNRTEISLQVKLKNLLEKRQNEYEKSHVILDVSSLTLTNFVALIRQRLLDKI